MSALTSDPWKRWINRGVSDLPELPVSMQGTVPPTTPSLRTTVAGTTTTEKEPTDISGLFSDLPAFIYNPWTGQQFENPLALNESGGLTGASLWQTIQGILAGQLAGQANGGGVTPQGPRTPRTPRTSPGSSGQSQEVSSTPPPLEINTQRFYNTPENQQKVLQSYGQDAYNQLVSQGYFDVRQDASVVTPQATGGGAADVNPSLQYVNIPGVGNIEIPSSGISEFNVLLQNGAFKTDSPRARSWILRYAGNDALQRFVQSFASPAPTVGGLPPGMRFEGGGKTVRRLEDTPRNRSLVLNTFGWQALQALVQQGYLDVAEG